MQHLVCAIFIFQTRSRACLKKAFRELQKTCRIHSFVSYRSILSHSSRSFPCLSWHKKAPPVGLEPTTLRLTAACSTDWAMEDHSLSLFSLHVPSKLHTRNILLPTALRSTVPGQTLDRLVTVSSIHYCTSTSALSTSSSSRGLTSFEWDISSWGGLHA